MVLQTVLVIQRVLNPSCHALECALIHALERPRRSTGADMDQVAADLSVTGVQGELRNTLDAIRQADADADLEDMFSTWVTFRIRYIA